LVVAFLIGCVVLVVGASGVRAEASQHNKHKHTEATNNEQGRSPKATASEEARCEGTRTYHVWYVVYPNGQNSSPQSGSEEDMKKADKKARHNGNKVDDVGVYTTNDLPGCPKGGLLLGTDKSDRLEGKHGDDEVRGLGARDSLYGGAGDDVIYGGDGNEDFLSGDQGEDVIYGGDGNDILDGQGGEDGQRDKLYCGKGKDRYLADKNDYVDSSCENKQPSNYFVA
jgi:hypothetical protein